MASIRSAVFLDQLRDGQFLEKTQLEEIGRTTLAKGDDAAPLARDLVNKRWLTSFQVKYLLEGRGKDLQIGPYTLMDRIGEGGMGYVYKAFHSTTDRIVALKVIRKEKLNSPNAIKRFQQEVSVISKMSHPNIVGAFDYGTANGTHYFAMEYVDGTDLSKKVKKEGPLPLADACEYVRQAALGLQHADEHDFVHRDIKPGNLMLTKASSGSWGVIKILDMGLARLDTEEAANTGITRVGTVVGTPDYLAPEQAKDSKVDIRADLYSLGCTFYYLLVGQPPFRGTSVTDVLFKHQTEAPVSVEVYRPDAPMGVQAIVRKLLAKKPEDRYQTPSELATALAPFCQKKNESGAKRAAGAKNSSPAVRRPRKPARKKSRRLLLASAVLLLAVCVLGVAATTYPALNPFHETSGAVAVGPDTPATSIDTKPQPETRPDIKPETKPETRPETRAETKPEKKPETKPETKPDKKPETKPETKPDIKPGKAPIPDEDKVVEARKKIQEKYKDKYALTDQEKILAFANQLRFEAVAVKNDPVTQYALFIEAVAQSSKAANLDLILMIPGEIDKFFVIDVLDMKIRMLRAAADSPVQSAMKQIAERSQELAEPAIDNNSFPAAALLLEAAEIAARKAGLPVLVAQIRTRAKDVADMAHEYETAQQAHEFLKTNPDDPAANLKWGRYLAFFKGKWDEAIPFLKKATDPAITLAAREEGNKPSSPKAQRDLGDRWYDLAEKSRGLVRKQLFLRAKFWYSKFVNQLDGLDRIQVNNRLNYLEAEIKKEQVAVEKMPDKRPPPPTGREPLPNTYDYYLQIGLDALNKEGDYQKAITAFNRALVFRPGDATAMAGRARAKKKLDEMVKGK